MSSGWPFIAVDAKTIFATFVDPNNGQGGVLACRHSRPARVQLFLTAAAINFKRLAQFCEQPPKAGSHQTPGWREMDSNLRFCTRSDYGRGP